jgi:SAM-dependent methyltransferase
VTLRFDQAYYRRFYLDPATRVYDQKRHARLVEGVVCLIEWFGTELQTVLDVGAGLGWWGHWLRKHRKGVSITSTELEPDTCRQYGHVQADITTLQLEQTFDLVICQGVLPYLDKAGVAAAIDNLAALSGRFLYLEAITKEDFAGAIDAERTDLRVTLHPAALYRRCLKPHFREVGGGLFARREADLPFFALEAQR